MTEKLKQIIKEEIVKLPKEIQEAINALDWVGVAGKIGNEHQLDENEINDFQAEVALILTGLENYNSFASNIESEIGIPKDEAEKIAAEVTQKIFDPIIAKIPESMKREAEEEFNSPEEIGGELDARFEKLPKEIKDVIEKSNYQATLYAIAKEHSLTVEQIGTLEKVVTNLMVGAIHPNDFKDVLEDSMEMPKDKMTRLANDVNEKILKPIRAKLVNLNNKSEVVVKTVDMIEPISTMVTPITPIVQTTPPPVLPKETIDKKDTAILSSHGIEITPTPGSDNSEVIEKKIISAPLMQEEKLELTTPAVKPLEKPKPAPAPVIPPLATPTPVNKPPEIKQEIHPILTQKLSSSFQIPTIKSQYVINDMPATTGEKIPVPPTQKSVPYPPKSDPYRLSPDE